MPGPFTNSTAGAAPLPPLPDFATSDPGQAAVSDPGMSSLVSGIAPIKFSVDQILAACKQIAQSGMVPGAEQACGQIVALATSLLPMAAQAAMQPMGGGMGMGAPPPSGMPLPPPPGPPQGAM